MKLVLSIMALICLLGTSLFLTGCSVKGLVRPVVEKAYPVVVQSESIVASADVAEFVTTVKLLETPLKLTKVALDFLSVKITDEKIKGVLAEASNAITKVNEAITDLDPEKIEEAKVAVLGGLETIKVALETVGEYVDADLGEIQTSDANADSIKELVDAIDELEKALEKAM